MYDDNVLEKWGKYRRTDGCQDCGNCEHGYPEWGDNPVMNCRLHKDWIGLCIVGKRRDGSLVHKGLFVMTMSS